jgi:hypothetical protein
MDQMPLKIAMKNISIKYCSLILYQLKTTQFDGPDAFKNRYEEYFKR